MEQANLPTQQGLNDLYGAWNPMSYMQGQLNQDLAAQFRDQAYKGNENTIAQQAIANDQAVQMNPLLLDAKRQDITRTGLLNDGSVIENQTAGLKLDQAQQTHQEAVAAAREKLKAQMSDDQYSQLGNQILQSHMDAIKGGNPEEIQKTAMLLDLVGGKVGGAVAKTIQNRGMKELAAITAQNVANTKADATTNAAALRPSAAAKAPADPYIAWNKLPPASRVGAIQGALTSGTNPVTHQPMDDAERGAFAAQLKQDTAVIDQRTAAQNQGVTASVDPTTNKIVIVKKETPSVGGAAKLSDDDLINKYLPKK
jgi:hypothetical protein